MKLFCIALAALLSFGSASAKAQDMKIAAAVVDAFNSSFKNVSEVQWKDCGNFYKADFTMNGQYVTAFYDQNANLAAVTRNISPLQLPVTLQASLKKNYEGYWVSDLIELSNDAGIAYYVVVENNDTKTTLKSLGNGWTTYKKERKS